MKQIDPRLLKQLDEASEAEEVEALVILDERGSASQLTYENVLAAASAFSEQQPSETRYLPKLGVLYVRGGGGLVRTILEDEHVVSASASDQDLFLPDQSFSEEE